MQVIASMVYGFSGVFAAEAGFRNVSVTVADTIASETEDKHSAEHAVSVARHKLLTKLKYELQQLPINAYDRLSSSDAYELECLYSVLDFSFQVL